MTMQLLENDFLASYLSLQHGTRWDRVKSEGTKICLVDLILVKKKFSTDCFFVELENMILFQI